MGLCLLTMERDVEYTGLLRLIHLDPVSAPGPWDSKVSPGVRPDGLQPQASLGRSPHEGGPDDFRPPGLRRKSTDSRTTLATTVDPTV